jgi:cytochrome c oxidase assembly protein subunit 15
MCAGAFVAGLDAGHAYNTFPLMNGHWIPPEYFSVPGWRSCFESTAAVQLHHRLLALTTLASVGGMWLGARSLSLPKSTRLILNGLLAVTAVQVGLGVATLLTYVPTALGSLHQANALVLVTTSLGLMHSLRTGKPLPAAVSSYGTPAALLIIAGVCVAVIQNV